MYLGSNMLRGTVVSGKIIKFDRGKIGIIFGKSLFLFMFKFNKFCGIHPVMKNIILRKLFFQL